MTVKMPKKRLPEISSTTKSGDILIWIKEIKDESNVNMLYKYNTLNFGNFVAYVSLINGDLYYKYDNDGKWNAWVEERDLGSDEDDGPEVKQLIKAYICKIIEKELLK